MSTEKSQERELRRRLKRAGYTIRKSKSPISIDNLGDYMIIALNNNSVAAGSRYDLSLEEVWDWISDMC